MAKKEGKKSIFTEFKEFITKGNVLDMAVGVIIGNSFKAIVTALTDKIIMPVVTYVIGDKAVDEVKTVLIEGKDAVMEGEVEVQAAVAEVAIYWGEFIQAIIDFLLVAIVLFVIVKSAMSFQKKRLALMEKLSKKEEEEPAPEEPKEPTLEEKNAEVLKEIRDLLAQNLKK